jgi:hypothetical protein
MTTHMSRLCSRGTLDVVSLSSFLSLSSTSLSGPSIMLSSKARYASEVCMMTFSPLAEGVFPLRLSPLLNLVLLC